MYGKALALALCLMAQLIAQTPAAEAGGVPSVVWDEDHVVDGIENYRGGVISLSGDLTVTGSLTLEGTELVATGQSHGDCAIKVESGGKLTVLAGSVIRSSDPEVHYTFAVYSGGRLTMNDSRVTDCGWDDTENGGDNPADVRGPYIASDRVAITNSTFTQNGFGLIIDGGSAPLVQDCNISRNHGDGVMIIGDSSPVFDRNTLVGNALTYPWFLCYQADLSSCGGAPRISNNTFGTVEEGGSLFPNEGMVLGDGNPAVEHNLVEGFDGDWASYCGIMVIDDCRGTIHGNILRGNLEAFVAHSGRMTVRDNTVDRGTPVSQMTSYGIEDGACSQYVNNTVRGYDTGVLGVSPSTSTFQDLAVTDCDVGVDCFSIPGATFDVVVQNSTLAQNGRDAQATNPHFGSGGKLSLINVSCDRAKLSAPGASERLVLGWYIGADVHYESDGRPATGALLNFNDSTGGLAAQAVAGADGSATPLGVPAPLALPEFIISGGSKSVKTPYVVSVVAGARSAKATVDLDRNRHVPLVLDDIAPWIMIESPADGALTNVQNLRVNGTCEPKTSVSLNGRPVTPTSDGRWSLVMPLSEGPNRISAVAVDAGGNPASAEIQVVLDTVRPALSVSSPREGLLTNRAQVTVSGTAEPGSLLRVNGAPVNCSGAGEFSFGLELFEGENVISIECRDAAGNLQKATRTVCLDTVPPALTVTSPKNGTLTREASVTLSGRSEDGATVTVNGEPVNLNGGAFSFLKELAEGDNLFGFQARDRAGNAASVSVSVRLDTLAPVMTIIAPKGGSLLNRSTVEVLGTAEAGASVKVQGVKAALQDGQFRVNLTIPADGPFTINVEARDAAGNTAEMAVAVTLDTVPPVLKLTSPAAGTVVNQTTVKVSGKSEPGARVRLDGMMLVADAKGLFTFTAALPAEGSNAILVEAEDAAGNVEEAQFEVFRDTVLSYNITAPAEKTRSGKVLVIGVAEPGASVTVAGIAVTAGANGSFSVEVPLETGPNQIKITVKDRAGNQGGTVLTVTREKPAAGKSTPGFECLLVLSAVALALAAWRKRE